MSTLFSNNQNEHYSCRLSSLPCRFCISGKGWPHVKTKGGARRKFSKNTLIGSRISFDWRGTIEVLPLGGTDSKTKPVIFCRIFQFDNLEDIVLILTVDILDFTTLNATKLQILTPERYDEHSRNLEIGITPRARIIVKKPKSSLAYKL